MNFQFLLKELISTFKKNFIFIKKKMFYIQTILMEKIILKSMSIFYFEGDYILSNEYKSEYYKKIGPNINFTKKFIKVLENWIKKYMN